jgi:hypothetical protein
MDLMDKEERAKGIVHESALMRVTPMISTLRLLPFRRKPRVTSRKDTVPIGQFYAR